jgi:hypothetical protein
MATRVYATLPDTLITLLALLQLLVATGASPAAKLSIRFLRL